MVALAIKGGTPVRKRSFVSWPQHGDAELQRLTKALASGHWAFDGPFEKEFEQRFAERNGARGCVAVTNGTVSLLLCLRALGIKPGDEVIVPALTWIATATSVLEANGVPVFVDIDPKTLCIDANAIEAAITPRTVAVIPVHLYWGMADMDAIMSLADRHGIAVIEDCAHAHGARRNGDGAGAVGHLGSYSFQSSKVMTSGEGGAIIGQDTALLNKVYSLKNCGRVVEGRGSTIMGGNHRMTEWQAAILISQLERLDEQLEDRNRNAETLTEMLIGLPGVTPLANQPTVDQRPMYRMAFHYDKQSANGIPRGRFIDAVRAEGIPITPPYDVVYKSSLYQTELMPWYSEKIEQPHCPIAEEIAAEGIFMLPHEILLGDEADMQDIANAFRKVIDNPGEAADLASRVKDRAKGFLKRFR